jgi:hypothetical protein
VVFLDVKAKVFLGTLEKKPKIGIKKVQKNHQSVQKTTLNFIKIFFRKGIMIHHEFIFKITIFALKSPK